jgi:hypothetical protein
MGGLDLSGVVLGLHLLTGHAHCCYDSATFGTYAIAPTGETVGVVRNSLGRRSVYAGMTWQTPDRRWALTAGGITGYPGHPVYPMVVPSYRMPLSDHASVRVAFLMKPPQAGGSAALTVSLEWRR